MNPTAIVVRSVAWDFGTLAFRVAPLAVLAAAATWAAAAGPAWSEAWGPLPWLVSLVFIGLPHGACDLEASRRAWPARQLGLLWMAYVGGMAVVTVGFLAAPWATLGLFVAASTWHFGLAHADGETPAFRGALARAVAALARGSPVLAVPLLAWPAETAAAANDLVALTHGGSHAALTPTVARAAGWSLAAVGMCAIAVEVARSLGHPAAHARLFRLAVESLVIAALGVGSAPLLSVGLYFLVWHAWRQMEPLAEAVAGGRPRSWAELATALTRVHTAALPLLIPAWMAIGGAWWVVSAGHTPRDLALVSIAAYLIVTPAHEVLGGLLRWSRGSPAG